MLQATGRGAAVLRLSGGGGDGGGGGGRGWVGNGSAVDVCCAGWTGLGQDPGHGGAGQGALGGQDHTTCGGGHTLCTGKLSTK